MAAARRGFLKAVASLPLATPALAAQSPPPVAPAAPAAPAAAEAADSSPASALAEAVRREHPDQLDPTALGEVRKLIARALERASRLRRAARLTNADPPVTTFSPQAPEAETPRS